MARIVTRANIIRISIIAAMMVVLGRIEWVQAHDQFIRNLESEWQDQAVIQPLRGAILDRFGDKLAFSVPSYDLDINIANLHSLNPLSLQNLTSDLANVTGTSQNFLLSQFDRTDTPWLRIYPTFVHLSLAKEKAILSVFNRYHLLQDVNPHETFQRVYPDGEFAAHVIGFVDQTGNGASGVELEYNTYLSGKPGSQTFLSDPLGNPIPFTQKMTKPVQNGDNVFLTIDPVIEHYAEQALQTVEQRFTPAHAAIIVADPMTGAILAMAVLPHFNPNSYWQFPAAALDTNWAISDPFEPGSTFKVMTLTGALATHAITLNQTYMSGVDYINGVPIRDWNLWGWGRISYLTAMIYSSNTGFIHIGQAEGVPTFYHYLQLFGLTQPTGIDLPGEGTSLIPPEQNLNAVDFATMTFGQGIAVTPIQQIAEVGAVANGGYLMKPYVVQKIVSPSGKIVYERKPEVVRQVASAAIMREITNVMVQDVANNPYETNAYIPGYNVAGKTGTAQIANPKGGGYMAHKYNLSFIGFVPAHHPQLEIYVTVNEPHNTIQYGNSVSSPEAKIVLQKSLAYLDIAPQQVTAAQNPLSVIKSIPYSRVPDVINMPIAEAVTIMKKAGFHTSVTGNSGPIMWQSPTAGSIVSQATTIALSANTKTLSTTTVVPDFKGLPMLEAIQEGSRLGLIITPAGNGFATTQSIKAGTKVALGTTVQVTFQSPVLP